MKLSLQARLFIAHALVVAAVVAGLLALVSRSERAWLIDRDREALDRTARHLVHDLISRHAGGHENWQALAATIDSTLDVRVTMIDARGRVLGDSRVPEERLGALENHAHRPEVAAALNGKTGWNVRRSASIGVELLYVAEPTPCSLGIAVLRVAEPLAAIARLQSSLIGLSIAAAVIALGVAIVLLLWLTGAHTARIAELEQAALKIGAGEAARARERPDDSVGRLGRAINHMADELRSRVEALEQERDQRESILAHMTDGVALIDREGRIVQANHACAEILGLSRPAESGTPFQEFARAPELEELLASVARENRTADLEMELWNPTTRRVRATATPLSGDEVLLVLHDLTEAEHLNRVRQDFVANVSHELRTPLTSLRGYAETLLDGGLEDTEHRVGFVRVIRDQASRLEALVEDLLVLAELERPDSRIRRERFDLRELVSRQIEAYADRARRAGLTLELESGAPAEVEADRVRIEQVLANLLDNAIKYTERGGVRVRIEAGETAVACEVADTGVGIPEDDQSRIFERFYRVDKARSREKGGTGLGLAIVKHIVALHGGDVSVQSQVGEGTVFRFVIPRGLRTPRG
jgi:two-component system, OmpR family, phosphate regulon sensor histidine kinase PhoR